MKRPAAAAGILTAVILLTGSVYHDDKNMVQMIDAEVQTEDVVEESSIDSEITIPVEAGTRIAVVSKNVKGEFWEMVRQGMETAVSDVNKAYGYKSGDKLTMTFEGPDDEQNVEEQINILDAVIAENPDVVCLSVGDMESCQAQLEAAAENGIPVVVFDSNVEDKDLVHAFRATDNILVGKMAGEKLAEAVGGTGKIAVFSAQEKTESAKRRITGFTDAIAEYEDIEIVETVYMDQVEDMQAAMSETLEKYPDLKGVFCSNADVADLYLGIEKDEDFSVLMVGVDATTRQQEAIEAGEEVGVVSQNPDEMGYQTIMTALQTIAPGEDVEEVVLLEPKWIDAASLESPSAATYLYE